MRRSLYWLPVWVLCFTQVISWGTLYYAFSVLLTPVGRDRSWNTAEMVGAFSFSLLVSGISAYPAGKLIYRFGGRAVMSAGSLLAAFSFLLIAWSPSLLVFYIAWGLAGAAMAGTLYEAAFSTLAALYEADYKRAVTAVTLAGGLASTVFWPLTERLIVWTGWHQTLIFYAGVHLCLCLPLHAFGLRTAHSRSAPAAHSNPISLASLLSQSRFVLLAGTYTLNAIVIAAVAVHLIPFLQSNGFSSQQAAWTAAFAGPMQVAGRLVEYLYGSRWRSRQTGAVAILALLPAIFGLAIQPAVLPVVLLSIGLYGISNGVMTIVRSISVMELFGRDAYSRVQGAVAAPVIVSRALGPYLAAIILTLTGGYDGVLVLLAAAATLSFLLFTRATR